MILHGNRRRRATLAAMTAGLLLVTGCGRRSTTGNSTAPATSTTAATTTTLPTTTATSATTATSTVATTAVATTAVATTAAPTSAPPDAAADKAAITANWERFFLPTTSIADRVALLENGASLQQALEQRAQDPLMGQASAVVKAIDLTEPDRAMVTYDVLLNGEVALSDAQGTAVRQGGVWKVGAESFCALISLGASEPIPGCS